jgi:hypothetical protein
LRRKPADYLGFVEVHIEQGPVLTDLGLPLGVVTSINGGVRFAGEVRGMASHAGTTPMATRRDAAAGRRRARPLSSRSAPPRRRTWSAPWACSRCPGGSTNVIPGRCRFSLDIRATTDPVRDDCVADVLAELRAICARRGVSGEVEETMRVAASPSAPDWQARWERAVAAAGLPVHRMPSGAGHDAMKLGEAMPQAMLFVRGENAGISHNPLESSTADDMQLAVEAFLHLLDELAAQKPGRRRHDQRLREARPLDRRPLRRGDRVPAGAGAGAHRHAARRQRAARGAHRRPARRVRLHRRPLRRARGDRQRARPRPRSPTSSCAAATAKGRRSRSTRTATSSRRAKAGRHDPVRRHGRGRGASTAAPPR